MSAQPHIVLSLNKCIEACVDAQRTYGVAAVEARDPSLKTAFQHRADERARFVIALQAFVSKLGAFPENQGTLRGALRRRWMEIEQAVEPAHDDNRVLSDLLREERAALETYTHEVSDNLVDQLPEDARVMLREQRGAMQADFEDLARHLAA